MAAQDQLGIELELSSKKSRIIMDPEATPEMPGTEPPQSADLKLNKQNAVDKGVRILTGAYHCASLFITLRP